MIKEIQKTAKKAKQHKSLQNIHVQNNIVYVSDLFRVLCIKTSLPDGTYIINDDELFRIADCDNEAPNFGSVALHFNTDFRITFNYENGPMKHVALCEIFKMIDTPFNIDFTDNILNQADGEIDMRYRLNDITKPVIFTFMCEDYRCLLMIMPLKGNDLKIYDSAFNSSDFLR